MLIGVTLQIISFGGPFFGGVIVPADLDVMCYSNRCNTSDPRPCVSLCSLHRPAVFSSCGFRQLYGRP